MLRIASNLDNKYKFKLPSYLKFIHEISFKYSRYKLKKIFTPWSSLEPLRKMSHKERILTSQKCVTENGRERRRVRDLVEGVHGEKNHPGDVQSLDNLIGHSGFPWGTSSTQTLRQEGQKQSTFLLLLLNVDTLAEWLFQLSPFKFSFKKNRYNIQEISYRCIKMHSGAAWRPGACQWSFSQDTCVSDGFIWDKYFSLYLSI